MIEQLMRAAAEQRKRHSIPAMADELLCEAAERYQKTRIKCPFLVGEIVTPRKDCSMEGAGDPHVVVEILDTDPNFFTSRAGSNSFGVIVDIRVLFFSGDSIVAHWAESWEFEPWQPAQPSAAGQA